MRRLRRIRESLENRSGNHPILQALLTGAAAIPTLMPSATCHAIGPSESTEARVEFFSYREWQGSDENRMRINAPMAWLRTPLGTHAEIEGSFVLDSVSGASPLYHDSLSGASGRGIEDQRIATDLAGTYYFETFSLTAGVSNSSEDDYDSLGGTVEVRKWTPDNNTVFQLGLSTSADSISSTNDSHLDESLDAYGIGIGVSQILDKVSMIQSNLTLASKHGYLSDPYKTFDLRPSAREEYAWLTRYVRYLPELDSSLHLDYRYFLDTWGVEAHTFEVAYYQPLGTVWMLRPKLRYYSQSKADFYNNEFPPNDPGEGFYTADQRLSGFGGLSGGIRLERKLTENLTAHISADYIRQEGSLKAWSPGSPGLDAFSATVLGVGFYSKF